MTDTCGKPTRISGMVFGPCTLPPDHGTLHCAHELDELACHCHLAPDHGACKACLVASAAEEHAAGVPRCEEHGGVPAFSCLVCHAARPQQEQRHRRALAVVLARPVFPLARSQRP